MTSIFLSKPWLQVMVDTNAIGQIKTIHLDKDPIHVGEYRAFGQKKWILYGSFFEHEKDKLEKLFQIAKKEGVFLVESQFNMSRWKDREFLVNHCEITDDFGTYLVDLSQSEQILWKQLHGKHRNMIQKAKRLGVEIRFELNLDDFLELMNQTYQKGQKENRFSFGYLQSLKKHLGSNLLLAGAYQDDILQAGLMVPFDQDRGYYLHGASRPGGSTGASNLLHWQIMQNLMEKGIHHYDLGGARLQTDDSRLQGIFRFKSRFGGRFEPCYYWQKTVSSNRLLVHNTLKKMYFFVKQ